MTNHFAFVHDATDLTGQGCGFPALHNVVGLFLNNRQQRLGSINTVSLLSVQLLAAEHASVLLKQEVEFDY